MIPRLPLEGIRVLELAMVVAGPFCGVLMAVASSREAKIMACVNPVNESVFRFNRRRTLMAAFQSLLGLTGQHGPTTDHGGGPAKREKFDLVVAVGGLESERPRTSNLAGFLWPRFRTAASDSASHGLGVVGRPLALCPR